jgi:hypothetical protein
MNRPKLSSTQEPISKPDLTAIPEARTSSSGIRNIADLTNARLKIIIPPEPKIEFTKSSPVPNYSEEMDQIAKAKFKVLILQEIVQRFLQPARELTFLGSLGSQIDPEDYLDAAFEYCNQLFSPKYSHNFEPNDIDTLQKYLMIGDWRTKDGIAELFEKLKTILAPDFTIKHTDGSTQTISTIKTFHPNKY